MIRWLRLLPAILAVAGCESYRASPLPAQPRLATSVADLLHQGPLPPRLGVADIAMLAAANNPGLRAERDRSGLAEAQVLQAGILPNPQLSPFYQPNLTAPAATTIAWGASLSQDVKALVTIGARKASARAAARSVAADVLWQEWQVIGNARLLAVDLMAAEQQRALLTQAQTLLADMDRGAASALASGTIALTDTAPLLVARNDLTVQLAALDRQSQRWHQQLAALIGLAPDAGLPLAERPGLAPPDAAGVRQMLPDLPRHRPDLVALQLGYQAQEETVRGAILAQFPALVVGLTGGRDNTNDYYLGPQVTFDLPVFDRNQGGIAIARATRQRLGDEYAVRLAAAVAEVSAMLAQIALVQQQIVADEADVAASGRSRTAAAAAYRAGNLDARGYLDFIRTDLAVRLQIAQLGQSLSEQSVAIETLTGAGMPAIAIQPDPGT